MDASLPCRFFQTPRGCLRGESCSFRHDAGASSTASAPSEAPSMGMNGAAAWGPPAVDPTSGVGVYSPGNPYANAAAMGMSASAPCRFFTSEAGCRNGLSCPFAHVGAAYPPPPPQFPFPIQTGSAMFPGAPPSPMNPQTPSPHPPPPLPTQPTVLTEANDPASTASTPTGVNGSDSAGKPRRKLNIQPNPSKKAHYEVISEIMPVLTRDIEGPFFAIDVECVATGTGVDDRDVARIAIVNEDEEVSYDRYVMPDKPIVSYLTQLTGISESNLVGAPSLAEALVELRKILPSDSVIVGQSIKKDLEWLGLDKGSDYKQMFDVADLFRIPMQSTNGTIRYRYFSLRHVAKYLLGHDIQEADHDPVIDAKYAMKIFKQFRHLHESPGRRDAVYQTLLQTPRTPSFAERYPEIDGVLMRVPRKPRDRYHDRGRHNYAETMMT
ncbi:hypothetical protein Poli38472_003928 [Pythium oligandrum]|uniref:C3H1-type domain-containing protein n=1 Tax=Pythium oligandrum TaxID=41045 RepID=A0A8K1FQ16_PYTOL|nr:hypothetical protein Poli38472_003928 [Pythium oligandrum]|eukprot:TMW66163.1 hypothetical protein Poli38472_003928 [Pythium oligandrum]